MTGLPFQQPAQVADAAPAEAAQPAPASSRVELDATVAAWLTAARTASAEIARLAEVRDRAYEQIKAAMGDAVEATVGGRPVVTWKPSKPGEYIDRKALEAAHPAIAAEFTKTKAAARPFKILEIEGGA